MAFWRQALCATAGKKKHKKKRKGKRRPAKAAGCQANFDVLAHHPINTSGGPRRHAINSNDASSADLDRIARVLRAAERAGTVLPGRHPLWATEMWWDSDPPTSPGSPPGRQARWIEDALYQAWKDGASVVINLAIRDFTTSGLQGGTGSGIFFADGRPKPSYTAFRFPFVTDRKNRRADPRLGQGSGRGQAGDPAQAREAMAGREEAPGAPGTGVPHQAADERQAPVYGPSLPGTAVSAGRSGRS